MRKRRLVPAPARLAVAVAVAVAWTALGCSSSHPGASPGEPSPSPVETDAEYQASVVQGMHDLFLGDIEELLSRAKELQSSAPTPADRGWDASADGAALATMKTTWVGARSAYERQEGAIAPLFPDVDRSIDARYDDFLAELGPTGDADAFDDQGVTGMHAIERILWADSAPARVVEFERTLPGYVPAAFPATSGEAAEFRAKLCDRLVKDVTALRDQWTPVSIHIFIAFQGLVSLMNEQREKVRKASSNEEESRYAERTLADIRDNLAGTRAAFALFEPWLLSKSTGDAGGAGDGARIAADIQKGFTALGAAYDAVLGDSLPLPPATWSSEMPSDADLLTPFGQLYSRVNAAVNPNDPSSIVSRMNDAATLLGFNVPGR